MNKMSIERAQKLADTVIGQLNSFDIVKWRRTIGGALEKAFQEGYEKGFAEGETQQKNHLETNTRIIIKDPYSLTG